MKTIEQDSNPVNNDISDEEDEEYILEQDPDYHIHSSPHPNQNKRTIKSIQKVNLIWHQIKQQELDKLQKEKQQNYQQIVDIDIDQIVDQLNQQKQEKKVRFAGQDYVLDKNGNLQLVEQQKEQCHKESIDQDMDQELVYREQLGKKMKYAKELINILNTKTKNINSVVKSKLDWKQFAEKEKIQKELNRNRKDGYLEKQNFILKVNHKIRRPEKR